MVVSARETSTNGTVLVVQIRGRFYCAALAQISPEEGIFHGRLSEALIAALVLLPAGSPHDAVCVVAGISPTTALAKFAKN